MTILKLWSVYFTLCLPRAQLTPKAEAEGTSENYIRQIK